MPLPIPSSEPPSSTAQAQSAADQVGDKLSEAGSSRREESSPVQGDGKTQIECTAKTEADERYEEAIEEEYAKREGGA